MNKILVTVGSNCIGFHTTLNLLQADNEVICIDRVSNSNAAIFDALHRLIYVNVKTYVIEMISAYRRPLNYKINSINKSVSTE